MLTPADLPAYLAHTVELARTFATAGTDLIAYGCTAAGFMAGPQRDAEVAAEISGLTGKPVVTTASAMTAALEQLGARRVTVVTPYLDTVNERLTGLHRGVGHSRREPRELSAPRPSTRSPPSRPVQIVDLARAAMSPRSDAMFIACSQLPTRAITRRSRARVRPAGLVVDTRDGVGRRDRDGVIRDK